jgi:hypothetical protein
MQLTIAQKIGFVGLIVSLILFGFTWTETTQKEFESELKRIASSDVDYLVLCEFHGNPRPQPCQTIHRVGNPQFAMAIRYLSQATSAPRPKASAASDKILKLGRGSLASNEYVACYRATKYPWLDQIYISPTGTDRECSWPKKYHAGSVGIPAHAFGPGAI